MDARVTRIVALLAVCVLLSLAAVGVAGCSSDEPAEETSESGNEETTDGSAATDGEMPSEEDAADIARAYFVAQTDFTGDQFDFAVEAMTEADDGTWYARVTATPKDDDTLETEQIYVYAPADSEAGFWFALDMGTGIDPATDDRFPEEVGEALTP